MTGGSLVTASHDDQTRAGNTTALAGTQIGVSVESAMRWLHPDAADMWKMTMSLSDVVSACADPGKRLPRQACRSEV